MTTTIIKFDYVFNAQTKEITKYFEKKNILLEECKANPDKYVINYNDMNKSYVEVIYSTLDGAYVVSTVVHKNSLPKKEFSGRVINR